MEAGRFGPGPVNVDPAQIIIGLLSPFRGTVPIPWIYDLPLPSVSKEKSAPEEKNGYIKKFIFLV